MQLKNRLLFFLQVWYNSNSAKYAILLITKNLKNGMQFSVLHCPNIFSTIY